MASQIVDSIDSHVHEQGIFGSSIIHGNDFK